MKTKVINLLLVLALVGCSKKQPGKVSGDAAKTMPSITVVETSETKERNQLKAQALELLNTKNYTALEALASKYRSGKDCYPDGYWKLAVVYNGLELDDNAPETEWQSRQKLLVDWIKARPESVMARITLARFLTYYAWNARSSAYAKEVKDTQWKLFYARLKQAWDVIKAAKSLQEKCPIYWSSVQQIALGSQLGKAQYDEIFNEAIQAFPDYGYYYNNRACFLLPRWYGAKGEWEIDLAKSADKIGGEKGDVLYARVVWDMHHYGNTVNVFKENTLSWERVDRGFAAIIKVYPDSLSAKNERAYLAAQAGDQPNAQKYFLETKGEVDLSVWGNKEEFDAGLKWAFPP